MQFFMSRDRRWEALSLLKIWNSSVVTQVCALVWFSWQHSCSSCVVRMCCLFNILFIIFTPHFVHKFFSYLTSFCEINSILLFNMYLESLIICSFIMFDCQTRRYRFKVHTTNIFHENDPLRKIFILR